MKIFFTASLRGAKNLTTNYKRIYDAITEFGYKNLDDEIFTLSSSDYYNLIEEKGREAYIKLYNKKIAHIQNADLCIYEVSLHSSSIGFEIQKSLQMNKPTLVLYLEGNTPHFLAGAEDDKLLVRSYTPETVKDVLKESIDELKEVQDKRFNFFISPKLLTYLEHASKRMGVTKSTFIRGLILDHMKAYNNKGSTDLTHK